MKIRNICIALAISLLCTANASAQKKKTAKPKAAKTVVKPVAKPVAKPAVTEPSAENLLYENMLESTQSVLVIDSIVVAKDEFLKYIPLPKECGTISPYQAKAEDTGYVYVNGFDNKMYYSLIDSTGNASLYTSDKLGLRWTKGTLVNGIDNENSPNYPFMMPDGITLYFAQKGEGSIGGYDIFVTRYDNENGEFLRSNNIGLPFNSTGNDYMYVVDELDSLGWFVSDRNQPEGKVCVYTFVPSKNRKNLDLSNLSDDEVRQYADLTSIRRTWTNKRDYNAAIARLQRLKSNQNTKGDEHLFSFIINDMLTYHSTAEFKSDKARELIMELIQMKERYENDCEQLNALRERYHNAKAQEIESLAPTILTAEQDIKALYIQIRNMEKTIRNEEIMFLTK